MRDAHKIDPFSRAQFRSLLLLTTRHFRRADGLVPAARPDMISKSHLLRGDEFLLHGHGRLRRALQVGKTDGKRALLIHHLSLVLVYHSEKKKKQ